MNQNTLPPASSHAVFADADGRTLKTTSRRVAEDFGKRHDNVLRDIENLKCSQAFNALNFEEVEYLDAKGEARRMVVTPDKIKQINAQARQVLHECVLQDLERCRHLLGHSEPNYSLVADALTRALDDATALAGGRV